MRWAPGLVRGLVVKCVLQGRFPGCGQAPCGAVGHPFAARGGMECCDRCSRWAGSIRRGDHATGGGHDQHDLASTAGWSAAHAGWGRQRMW